MAKLVECVPDISEGRDRTAIEAIAAKIRTATDATLLDVDKQRLFATTTARRYEPQETATEVLRLPGDLTCSSETARRR
jgi:glutamate formiminotransferase